MMAGKVIGAVAVAAALCGCSTRPAVLVSAASPPPGQRAESVVDREHSQAVTLDRYAWRLDGTIARGDFTVTNNGPVPLQHILLRCEVYGARTGFRIGAFVVTLDNGQPVRGGETRTYTGQSLVGYTPAAEDTVNCTRVVSARE